jgi:hypothetical protein
MRLNLRLQGIERGSDYGEEKVQFNLTFETYRHGRPNPCTIVVNADRYRVDWTHTDRWLLDPNSEGNREVVVVALPLLIALMPALWAGNKFYGRHEKRRGMSRHCVAVLDALAGQLPAYAEALLTKVFENEWRCPQKLVRKVSFEEAQKILSGCVLIMEQDMSGSLCKLIWYDDDGDAVARADAQDGTVGEVCVLDSNFRDEHAAALIECYRKRSIFTPDF